MALDASLLIHAGAVAYIIAFLARDELHLRLLALSGSCLYICYYFFFPENPLWDAIISSSILVIANLIVLGRILLERTTFSLSDQEKRLFASFEPFSPGQFRKILKIATWEEAETETVLTREAVMLEQLFFVQSGSISITKADRTFPLEAGQFVGEIAFILDRPPSGSVTVSEGARYIRWLHKDLHRLCDKDVAMKNALTALLTRDLAAKLSLSYQDIAPSLSRSEKSPALL